MLPPTTTDCVAAPATTTVSFIPDEVDNVKTIPTVTVKSTPKRPHNRKKSYPHTRVSSYPGLISVARVNE